VPASNIARALALQAEGVKDQNSFFAGGLNPTGPMQRSGPYLNLDQGEPRDGFGLFMKSTLSSMLPEMVGSTPSREIERYRAENPVAGFTSHLLGAAPFFLIPSLGPAKLLSKGIPGFTKAMNYGRALTENNMLFRGGALREVTRFAPWEAARVGGSLLNPEEGATARTIQGAGSELLALGVLGGGGTMFAARKNLGTSSLRTKDYAAMEAKEFRVATHIGPAFNRQAADQTKWDFVRRYLEEMSPEVLQKSPIKNELESLLQLYERSIMYGKPKGPPRPKGAKANVTRYVANMGSSGSTRRVESLFEEGVAGGRGAKGIQSKRSVVNAEASRSAAAVTDGFENSAEATLSEMGLRELATAAGLKKMWQSITQYPRELVLSSTKSKDRLKEILEADFVRVSDNEWMAQEVADGLTVVVKRLANKPAGRNFIERAAERVDPYSGRFYIFKTNSPSQWLKGASSSYNTSADVYTKGMGKWAGVENVPPGDTPTLNGLEKLWSLMSPTHVKLFAGKTRWSTDVNVSAERGWLGLEIRKHLPAGVKEGYDEVTRIVGQQANALRSVTAASRFLGSKNPRLTSLLWVSKTHFETQMARATNLILGDIKPEYLTGVRKPLHALFKGAIDPMSRRTGGTQALFRKHLETPEALADFNKIRLGLLTPDDAAAAGLHEEAVMLARKLDSVDEKIVREIAQQARKLGMEEAFIPKKGHYALANSWVGPWRVPLYDAVNPQKVRGYASGYTQREAGQEAVRLTKVVNENSIKGGGDKLLETYGETAAAGADRVVSDTITHAGSKELERNLLGIEALQKEMGVTTHATDLNARQADVFGFATQIDLGNSTTDAIIKARSKMFLEAPYRWEKSKGFFGARGTTGVPFSLKELETTHSAGIIESFRYLAREAQALGPMREQLMLLAKENSVDAVRFNRVFNSFNGVQGPTSKIIDKTVDAVMADWVGPGSAMRIVRRTNEAMFMLTLGAMDLGFASLNLITPIQTAIPEVAWLTSGGVPAALQKWYSPALFKMPEGGFRQGSFLDVARFAKNATQSLLNPTKLEKQALQRAVEEHAIGRDFVETAHGGLMQRVAEGPGGIWANIQKWSEFPVVWSEEASRAYSFLLGRSVGKDFFKMGEEEAYQFARQFVQNTMYGYAAADRPRMITGALGSGWGLFKNWTTNYIGNMARYTGEASRGNFSPLLWSMAGSGAVGGLTAMPLMGMADGFARMSSDKGLNDLLYDQIGNDPTDHTKPWAADMLAHGFPSLLGMTLRSRASAPSAHLSTDITMYANMAIVDRMQALGDSLGTFTHEALNGRAPLGNPQFMRQLMQAFAPRTLQRAMTSFGEKGVTSLSTGNSLVPALNTIQASLASVGLTPIKVANTFEVQQEAFLSGEKQREMIQSLGSRLADAQLNGDHFTVGRIIREAIDSGVKLDSVSRSAQARMSKEQEPYLSRQHFDAVTRSRLSTRGLQRDR